MIDGILKELRAFNDRTMRDDIAGDDSKLQQDSWSVTSTADNISHTWCRPPNRVRNCVTDLEKTDR